MVPTMWSVVLQSTCYNHGAQVNKILQCTAWSVVHAWSILQTLNWVHEMHGRMKGLQLTW